MGGFSELHASGDRRRPQIKHRPEQRRRDYATGGVAYSDEGASRLAAQGVKKKLNAYETKVFAVLKADYEAVIAEYGHRPEILRVSGLTADEIAVKLDWDKTQVRPRLTGLANKKRIKKTGITRKSEMGKPSAVWKII